MYFDSIDDSKKSAITRIALLGIASMVALVFLTIKSVIPSIEKDLLQRVSVALYENKLDNIIISVRGQDITLEGLVTHNVQSKAVDVASQVKGVENLNVEFIIVSSLPKTGKAR